MRRRNLILSTVALQAATLVRPSVSRAAETTRSYAVSLLAPPKLPADFPHFPYVNPDAPKGGEVVLASDGSYDNFNPFILRGVSAAGVGTVWETLLKSSADEAAVAYGHLAAVVETPADNSWVAYEIRPEARFWDGTPVTAEDVKWSFDTLLAQGRPSYRTYWADVAEAVAESPSRVVFRFRSNQNRELPLIMGQVPVLPKHWWQSRDFTKPLTEPPLGSGPYRVARFELGRSVAYERVADWWARDRPTGRGTANFGTLRYEYFRDATVAFEAFKAGQIDFRQENIARQWATGYDFPAVKSGQVRRETVKHGLPTGMQGFFFNTRRPIFADPRVREALVQVFDFEWENKNLFFDAYTRTTSYFSNSDLASSGIPEGAELALLERHRAALPPALFTTPYTLPVTDGSGNNRDGLRRALGLLKEAGLEIRDRKLLDRDGKPFSFELVLDSPTYERVALPYVQWLARLGIEMRVRTVDPAQYQRVMDTYDYDMTMMVVPEGEHPGNEQADYWTCASAKMEGTANFAGACDPVVDDLVARVISAADYPALLVATHALDRVLLWHWYVVPHWHSRSFNLAYRDRLTHLDRPIRAGFAFDTWWVDPARAATTEPARP